MWRPRRILLVFAALTTLFLVLPAVLWELESRTRPVQIGTELRGVPAPMAISDPVDEAHRAEEIAPSQSLGVGYDSQHREAARGPARPIARDFRNPNSKRSHEANPTPSSESKDGDSGMEAPVELDDVELAPGALSMRATGFDPAAPRDLTLYRIGETGAARLLEATSNTDGSVDFGTVLVPVRGIELVATAKGRKPAAHERAGALRVRAAVPQPRIAWLENDAPHFAFEVQPVLMEGWIVLADARGEIIERFEIERETRSPDRKRSLAIELTSDGDFVHIAHELPDGRSSDWRILELDSKQIAK